MKHIITLIITAVSTAFAITASGQNILQQIDGNLVMQNNQIRNLTQIIQDAQRQANLVNNGGKSISEITDLITLMNIAINAPIRNPDQPSHSRHGRTINASTSGKTGSEAGDLMREQVYRRVAELNPFPKLTNVEYLMYVYQNAPTHGINAQFGTYLRANAMERIRQLQAQAR